MSRFKKAGQNSINIAYGSFEGLAKFKYMCTTLTDQNCMNEEMKSILKSGNAYYHSVQSLLSFCVLSRNVKVKVQNTVILLVVLYGYEIWSHTKGSDWLRVFENRVLRRIFGPERDELTG
jgi:hypothetical protein